MIKGSVLKKYSPFNFIDRYNFITFIMPKFNSFNLFKFQVKSRKAENPYIFA